MAAIDRSDLIRKLRKIPGFIDDEGDALVPLRELCKLISLMPDADIQSIIKCKDCQHCRLLNDGISFECTSWEMYFYAPNYSAETFFCGDAIQRTAQEEADAG